MKKLNIVVCALLVLGACDFSFNERKKSEVEHEPQTWETARPLQDIYKNDFLMGNIISPRDLGTVRFAILTRHYNTLTAENQMKPDHIAPAAKPSNTNWEYRFTEADRMVNAAIEAKMKVVGHTLVWHSQTPSWLTEGTKQTVLANMEKYIGDVAGHFKDKLIAWDVVNEAFRDGLTSSDVSGGKWENCLRTESGWYKAIGPEYIEKAFLAARTADPNAKRYYNDYNLNSPTKSQAVYNMVIDINVRHSNLIEGIGMQSHHHLGTDPQTVRDSIQKFASLGVEIAISEMDIMAADGGALNMGQWSDSNSKRQAALYAAMFAVFKAHKSNITRVTFWGLDDGTSWRATNYPTLLDKDYNLKPAFFAVTDPNLF